MLGKVLGILKCEQTEKGRKERNDRVIAVPLDVKSGKPFQPAVELDLRLKTAIADFSLKYNELQNKKLRVIGFEAGHICYGHYLFVNSKGRPYLSDYVVKQVHKTMAKLGIPRPKGMHVGVHAFRHGASSELIDAGTSVPVVSGLLRHSNCRVTLNNYAHVLPDS